MVKKLRKVVIIGPDEKHKNNKRKSKGPINLPRMKPPRIKIKTARGRVK